MTENQPTPAEAIPFALVDENGHLTGKPAEGVAAAIAAVAKLHGIEALRVDGDPPAGPYAYLLLASARALTFDSAGVLSLWARKEVKD